MNDRGPISQYSKLGNRIRFQPNIRRIPRRCVERIHPGHLKHWWGTPGSSIEIARHELKPGGMFHYRMKFPDGRAMWARFIFREIAAPERLVWLNGFSDEHGDLTRNPWVPTFPLETLNTVTLAEQDGKSMQVVNKLMRFKIAVSDMPKAKAFYVDKLGLKDDLYGPGSGVKWFNLKDPDGNQVLLVQA
jgi:uncharacterized protein YndB with AHSA1/START domain